MDLADILLRSGMIDQQQVNQSRESKDDFFEWMLKQPAIDTDAALKVAAKELGVDFVDLRSTEVDLSLLDDFPQKLIYREVLFPVERFNGSIRIATANPLDFYPLDEIAAATGLHVEPVLADRIEISKLIKKHLGVGGETIEDLIVQKSEDGVELLEDIETDGSELSEMAQEASVVRLVNEILLEAIETRTSDVHIESQNDGIVVRYRIDGILHTQPVPPEINHFRAAIISRLKIMARLNMPKSVCLRTVVSS